METALLRLFNAAQVNDKQNKSIDQSVLERTVRNGYILDPAIHPNKRLLNTIESVVGMTGEKANAAFHKCWAIVQDSPLEQLILQQIIHYITTYGFESLGIYQKDAVYIPRETLELPAIETDIPLIVIKAMDSQEILDSIVNLGSGIALAQETLKDIMTVIKANHYDNGFVQKIGNRELKALLYNFYEIIPAESVEFLRYLVSKLTGESLLIKNDYLIGKIKSSDKMSFDLLLEHAPDDLASVFFRFKPLFLAMKSVSNNKSFFNRLRKKAKKLHTPMPEDYLNSVTSQIRHGKLDSDILQQRLKKASPFRKIRLAYALRYRTHPANSIVYRVRNGRGCPMKFKWPDDLTEITRQALNIVVASITDDIRKNVNGKTIYIPSNIHYALPATEKQFTGHLPTGTYVSVPQDMIVGIHWTNTDKRVDLDLSMIGESGKTGWDADYRSEEGDILFSGDMTDAPPPFGASELFYVREVPKEAKILMANYYNFQKGDEVSCKILVAQEKPEDFSLDYMVDVNNIVAFANININKEQTVLGLIANIDGENRIYFANVGIGNSITSSNNSQSVLARNYMVKSSVESLDFKEILAMAGANVVDEKPDAEHLDLSPEMLDKTTIIDLIN